MSYCIGFEPSVDNNSKILILGSMPGISSLQQQQYYAHPQNRFWRLWAYLLQREAVPHIYSEKLQMLLDNNIALWDSIAACNREGSLDNAIENEQSNDFKAFFKKYPKIYKICFNGGKSYNCFKKYNKDLLQSKKYKFYQLPSTSPANARFSFVSLCEAWKNVLD